MSCNPNLNCPLAPTDWNFNACSIGVWGFGGVDNRGDEYPLNLLTPWVDVEIIRANPNLFVNTMSYHWLKDCSIKPWRHRCTSLAMPRAMQSMAPCWSASDLV